MLIVWLSVLISCFICASLLVATMWQRFSNAPTVTVVKDTHLPLHLFPFPAISICPNNKIKRTVAIEYISRQVKIAIPHKMVHFFLNVLSLFQHPYYSRMLEYLDECEEILPDLEKINITDLMIMSLPACRELLLECSWHGKPENCCELFSLQRSEEGFCYTFNSMTSQKHNQCNDLQNTLTDKDTLHKKHNDFNMECILRRNTAAGAATGMEVFMKGMSSSEFLPDQLNFVRYSGVRVQVHHVTEYPEAGMGFPVPAEHGTKMSATVKPSLTRSTDAIRNLPVNVRNCYFADEKHLGVSNSYTEKSCLIECRLDYLFEVCGCRPYYFNLLDNTIPVCNASRLRCVAEHSVELRFFSPPTETLRGFEEQEMFSPLNCSDCLPTCHENMYDVDNELIKDTMPMSQTSFGYLDIYYKNEGAVKYQRDVTFGWLDLLVSFGGIAGLFLGFSLLSIVEVVYWAIKFSCLIMNFDNKVLPAPNRKIFVRELTMNKKAHKKARLINPGQIRNQKRF
ncbi:sodium channel protein Nach-like isoform X2 [Nilaparvata lugens]|uniref:sodium channel protein Nach-like isoform X2 n=1 Tax=Nilaparvata lugens TaxID=108931 RepID=UPI00193D3BAB|nr:sodium channel protein Nach-like isoform X2 [Nilaparvata lugens]